MRIFKYLANERTAVIVIILLLFIQAACDLSLPAYTSDIVDVGILQGGIPDSAPYTREEYIALGTDMGKLQTNYMLLAGGKMLGITLIASLDAVIVCLIASLTSARIGRNLRSNIYKKTLSFSHAEIDRFSTASLIIRNTNDIQQIQMALAMIMRMVLYAPILGIGSVIMVMRTKTGMSWIIGVALAFILLIVVLLVKFTMPKFMLLQKLLDRLNRVSREILTGLPVIRAFTREKHEEKRFDTASRELMAAQLFTNRAMSLMMPLMMLVMNIIMITIVWFGAKGIDLGNLKIGDMMAFIAYTMQIVMSFMMLSMMSILLPRANVSAERVDEVINAKLSILDPLKPEDEGHSIWKGEIRFENVSFRFPGANEDVLKNINFTAHAGKTSAIIGSTGSGKSTLINLIPRFYDVTDGSITIDGIDIRKITKEELHNIIGFVPQKAVLFSGNIKSNIKFGNPDITDADMEQAADIAQANEFIIQKEGIWNSPIAQGGFNISGGQKQRLSIARAIAKKPKILIFDDSFSSLDYKTDTMLRRALREKVNHSAVIIVAQRISTVLHADQIIVLNQGEIADIGTHKELMERCGTYIEIAKSQLSEKELRIGGGTA